MNNVTAVIRAALTAAGVSASLLPTRDEGADRDLAAMPYTVAKEGISTVRSPASGHGVARRSEFVQIDLFQNRAAGPDDPTLMPAIWAALEAAPPAVLQTHRVLRLLPESSVRRYNRPTKIVTESLTVRVTHTS